MFHELAHYLLHAPNHNETPAITASGARREKRREADAFALVALIPQNWLLISTRMH
jgi:Zn-dependent peptidase ImmA (M78 family)